MKIIDLTPEHENIYFKCLEEWSDEMKEAGDHKCQWYNKMKDKGLGVKLALDDNGNVGGMIQYTPIAHSPAQGADTYFIHCIWVHGYKKGRGNFQKKGMGKALLKAAEEDARARGAKGMAAWGLTLPIWMKASWFKKRGYKKVDSNSIMGLMWKPFTGDAQPPKWVKANKKPQKEEGKVVVTAFHNGWCCSSNINYERTKRIAAEFGDKVDFRTIDTFDRENFQEWGISDAIFVGGKNITSGPPMKPDKIRKKIARQVRKLKA